MAKSLEFYIWVANDTLIGCNVQMALPTASPASLLRRGVLSRGPSLCVLAHRVVLQRRREETRVRAEGGASPPALRTRAQRSRSEAWRSRPQRNAAGKARPGDAAAQPPRRRGAWASVPAAGPPGNGRNGQRPGSSLRLPSALATSRKSRLSARRLRLGPLLGPSPGLRCAPRRVTAHAPPRATAKTPLRGADALRPWARRCSAWAADGRPAGRPPARSVTGTFSGQKAAIQFGQIRLGLQSPGHPLARSPSRQGCGAR